MWVLYQGVQYAIYPSIIFMGIGAMTDFGPLLANPVSLLLGAAVGIGSGSQMAATSVTVPVMLLFSFSPMFVHCSTTI